MLGPTHDHKAFVEAGIGIVMTVIMADGQFSQDEYVWWKKAQMSHPLFANVPPEPFNAMLQSVKAQLSAGPYQPLVDKWAKSVPEQYRVSIFELATELATVDKDIAGREPEVLKYLWQALGIPDELGRRIFMSRIEKM